MLGTDKIIGTTPEQAKEILRAEGFEFTEWGDIKGPGKFEGAPWFAPLVYEWLMDGDHGEELSDGTCLYTLHNVERETFGLLRDPEDTDDEHAVSLYISDQGFVYVSVLTRMDYETAIFEDQESEGDESDY